MRLGACSTLIAVKFAVKLSGLKTAHLSARARNEDALSSL